jgi:sugar phosphate isomerase/epimerase
MLCRDFARKSDEEGEQMKVGIIIRHCGGEELRQSFADAAAQGFRHCQLVSWDPQYWTGENAEEVKAVTKEFGIEITAFWCGWEGPRWWNFYEGQLTLGLVPEAYRFQRLQMLEEGSDCAAKIGVADLITHVGYMPENPYDEQYPKVITALKHIVGKCARNEQYFLFETGQETPVTLLRAIQDIGMENVGINLDPANLIMYGKANPVDALDVFGKYVRGVHGKDGLYPTDGRELGQEVPIGEGKVDFPRFIARLKECGYDGDITIEREISGEEQARDIIRGKEILDRLI